MKDMSCGKNQAGPGSPVNPLQGGDNTMKTTSVKKHRITITLSDDDFSVLEKIRQYRCSRRSPSNEIAWLIVQEWERLQEQERAKTPAEILKGIRAIKARFEKQAADYAALRYDTKIIQFPVPARFIGNA
jgi:hypothetical protein